MKHRPDKYPDIDVQQRGIFEVIIATAADVRKQRQTKEHQESQRRQEEAEQSMRKLRAREAKADESERLARERSEFAASFKAPPVAARLSPAGRPSADALRLRDIRARLPGVSVELLPQSLLDRRED